MEEPSYGEFIDKIIRPPILSSFRSEHQRIRVEVQGSSGTVEEFTIDDIYPFHTIGDLCTRIYTEKGERDEFHPINQCLMEPSLAVKGKLLHLQYIFNGTSLLMLNPYQRLTSEPDSAFVDLTGNVKMGSITSRNDMLLEKTLFRQEKEEYVVYVFLYGAILSAYPGEKPISRIDWEGKFKPYFPEYNKAYEDGSIPEAIQQFTPKRVERFQERLTIISALNDLLESKPLRIIGEAVRDDDVNVSNIRNLRLGWRGGRVPFQLEGLFYDIPVGELIPYVRFYPKANTPISKLFVEGADAIPKMDDPTVLVTWAGMRSITPDEDLLMMKVLVKRGSGSSPPVYATFYVFEDGSAKFILQPSSDQKSLSGDVDLVHLPDTLRIFFSTFPRLQPFVTTKEVFEHSYTAKHAVLEDAYMVLSLWLSLDATPITTKRLNKVLPYFKAFFQETSSPIKEQRPILFLRYKCVNDFRTPSREAQYLQRIIDLQKVAGRTSVSDMERYFQEEFSVSEEVAKERVAAFLSDMTKFAIVNPEIREVTQVENPGIDIAIFGKHPFYTFHIYRVDSVETLQRIKTLLSLFVSVVPSDLSELEEAAEVLEEEETASKKDAEIEAVGGSGPVGGSGVGPAPAEDAGFELDALGELPEFEDTEALETLIELDAETGPVGGPVGGAVAAAPVAEEDDDDAEAGGEVSAKTYFSRRLRKYDSSLFKYAKVHKSTKSYPQQCQANAIKQPSVLNEGEFKRMKELYKPDVAEGKLQWIEYPLKEGQPVPGPPAKKKGVVTEKVTVLRYGTNLDQGKANIYTCSEFWCMADELVILKGDFEGVRARDIRTGQFKEDGSKPSNTCPFCKRGLVRRKEKIEPTESVIQRTTPKAHTFIGFLGKGNPTHPKGFHLPCCFLKDKVIYSTYPAYKDEDVEEKPAFVDTGPMTYDYSTSDSKISNKKIKNTYITGPEKLPLEFTPGQGPQIGVLPQQADAYFSQTSNPDLVKQDHTFWKIMTDNTTKDPSVSGFFRVAVENRGKYEADSFFAAVAPFYGYTGADALKERIYEVITPIMFMSLNYGNFLFEFYDPSFEIAETPLSANRELLRYFADALGIKTAIGVSSSKEPLLRGLKGYLKFKGKKALSAYRAADEAEELGGSLFNRSVLKESRQFYSLFTYPNTMTWTQGGRTYSNGVMFIILEISKGSLQVKCPPYGVSPKMADTCDIGFLLHYKEDRIWEPVFYTHNNIQKKEHYTTFIFTRDTYPDWPAIVKERVGEFSAKCKASGLGIYTESKDVDPSVLIPLSAAKSLDGTEGRSIYAILRDTYNHVSAVLFKEPDRGVDTFIFLPVIDDGSVYQDVSVELSWRHFLNRKQISKANVVDAFYAGLDPLFDTLPATVKPMYERKQLFSLDKTAPAYPDLYAYHLGGGLFVPVFKPDVLPPGTGTEKGDEIHWMVDSKIVYTSDTKKVETFMDSADFEEIYQHLRFTFANWLSTVEGSVLSEINAILYDADGNTNLNYSVSEKRTRLFIKIGRTILGWLDSSLPQVGKKPTLKRMDCRILRDAETCNNRCVWKGESSECLIHIPKEYTVGRESVSANAYMVKRIIEELIRFPIKRKELLTKRVRQYVTLRAPFRSGDSYIIPESLPQWTELLRMDWMKKKVEMPTHVEEFTWATKRTQSEEMPEELVAYLGASSFFFLPQLDGLRAGYIELGVPPERVPEGILSREKLLELAEVLKLSIFQMQYEYDVAIPKDIKVARAKKVGVARDMDYIVSVILPDGAVGFLSTLPDRIVAIPSKELPSSMKESIKKGTPVFL